MANASHSLLPLPPFPPFPLFFSTPHVYKAQQRQLKGDLPTPLPLWGTHSWLPMVILSLCPPFRYIFFPTLDSLNSPTSQHLALCDPFLSNAVQGERRFAGKEQKSEEVDPVSFLEDWEGRTHSLWAFFGHCPLELKTTSLATPQLVTITP